VFDQQQGSITVIESGGVEPVTFSLDGIHSNPYRPLIRLDKGAYNIIALDANDCEVQEVLWINVPLAVNVELGVKTGDPSG
jgi:hypothetical protein